MLPAASLSRSWRQGEGVEGAPFLRGPDSSGTPRTGSQLSWEEQSVALGVGGAGSELHSLVVGQGWELGGGRVVKMEDFEMANLY